MTELSWRTVNTDVTRGPARQCLQCPPYDRASERFQTARREKWFAANAIFSSCGRSCSPGAVESPNCCTIVRVAALARSDCGAPSVFVVMLVRGSVARGYSGGRGGLHAASLAKLPRVSCYAPCGRLHTLALPPSSPHSWAESSRRISARGRRRRTISTVVTHSSTQSDRDIQLEVGARNLESRAIRQRCVKDRLREGVSVPRGGALARSKRLARSFARLAACKRRGDEEWNARDRPARPIQHADAISA